MPGSLVRKVCVGKRKKTKTKLQQHSDYGLSMRWISQYFGEFNFHFEKKTFRAEPVGKLQLEAGNESRDEVKKHRGEKICKNETSLCKNKRRHVCKLNA